MAAWYNCDVTRTGPGGDNKTYIMLRDRAGAFPERWFVAIAARQKEMLATALTAITTSLTVRASLASTDEYAEIASLFVQLEVP
jgi:hypothetical protein